MVKFIRDRWRSLQFTRMFIIWRQKCFVVSCCACILFNTFVNFKHSGVSVHWQLCCHILLRENLHSRKWSLFMFSSLFKNANFFRSLCMWCGLRSDVLSSRHLTTANAEDTASAVGTDDAATAVPLFERTTAKLLQYIMSRLIVNKSRNELFRRSLLALNFTYSNAKLRSDCCASVCI